MCADLADLKPQLAVMQEEGIEYLHIDVMDGVFVPNLMLSSAVAQKWRAHTRIPYDYHLMITAPEAKADMVDIRPGDMVSVHIESTPHISRALQAYKAKGASVGVALNPATPVESIKYILPALDFVLLMLVNPGFAGQRLVEGGMGKIADMRAFLRKEGYKDMPIEVDGNVSFALAAEMRACGADIFVAGTSSIFHADIDLRTGIDRLRRLIGE
jgi:ribulose-phosphate 3-epimerase